MDLNTIKEYLVGLGFAIDERSYSKFQKSLKDVDSQVQKHVGGIIASYAKAATMVVGAIGTVTLATTGLLDKLGQADLEYKKFALRMFMTAESAKNLKIATDALGESMNDIAWIPELRHRYEDLVQLQQRLGPPAQYEGQMKRIRDTRFEFTKLKVELQYGAMWVGHHLMNYLNGPFNKFDNQLKRLNDWLVVNMPVWTAKVAKFLSSIIQLGGSATRALGDLGEALGRLWDRMSVGQKKLALFAAAFTAFFLMGPVGRALTIVTGLVIAIDDFYAYIDGRKSSKTLAPIWYNLLNILHAIKAAFGDFSLAFSLAKDGKWREAARALGRSWDTLSGSMGDLSAHNKGEEEYVRQKRQEAIRKNWNKWREGSGLGFLSPLTQSNMDKVDKDHKSELDSMEPGWRREYQERTKRADEVGLPKSSSSRSIGPPATSGSGSTPDGLSGIVRQESGGDYGITNPDSGAKGKYQIMPYTWKYWAPKAGLPSNAPMTPANQDRVAKTMHDHYFKKYGGDSRLIAAAWYGGEGVADALMKGTMSERAFHRRQGPGGKYPSIASYIRSSTGRAWVIGQSHAERAQQSYLEGSRRYLGADRGKTSYASNTTIGDVHVHVSSTNASPEDIAKRTREELRRREKMQDTRNMREFSGVYA